jgi:hypothetical protein
MMDIGRHASLFIEKGFDLQQGEAISNRSRATHPFLPESFLQYPEICFGRKQKTSS